MKKKYLIILCAFILITANSCKKDYLVRDPLDKFADDTYWRTEKEVSTFAWGFYPKYFAGYGSSYTFGRYFSGETFNDDFGPTSPNAFTKVVPSSDGSWAFDWVRKANIFIDRVHNSTALSAEARNNWEGIGRFFRAMEYSELVKGYGDVPYYDKPLAEDSKELYKPRDSRIVVLDAVLADMKFAAENVRVADATLVGPQQLIVNKMVVLAFMSRIFLYHGTLLKYHNINPTKAAEYLEAARWAANEVMTKGGFSLNTKYRTEFSSLDLKGNPEVILYRQYAPAQIMHSLVSYVNREAQTGASKNAIESYLCSDGLPIAISPLYQQDHGIANVMANRDARIKETFVSDQIRVNGNIPAYSTTGYSVVKFLVEDPALWNSAEALSNTNSTDAPIIRYGEVLLNYIEAVAELGTITQTDLDKSINLLRSRPGINMPPLQIIGGLPAVHNVVYDDPKRDASVPSLIWEIRRERRVELMMEGFRNDDLRRWKKFAYLDTQGNVDINRGAWIVKADYPGASAALTDGATGYIIPASVAANARIFDNDRVYLRPLPLDQIKLYKDQGVTLTQNPGWN